MLQPPQDTESRSFSLRNICTSSIQEDHTGEVWKMSVTANNCWENLILTLDGGGIRGYSSLLILQQLMCNIAKRERRIQEEEGPVPGTACREFNDDDLLPCHYFDYMYGTSTGGLISIMLARLQMTVPQCLDMYREVGHKIFSHRRNILWFGTKYDHKPLEKVVRDIVRQYCRNHEKCEGNDWFPWCLDDEGQEQMPMEGSGSASSTSFKPAGHICQSICLTAIDSVFNEAFLLRSYHYEYDPNKLAKSIRPYNTGIEKMRIWQVARATSAAPFYFKTLGVELDGAKRRFKDGAIRENNPSYAAYIEHSSLNAYDEPPALLLSVGTGLQNSREDGFATERPGLLGKIKFIRKWSDKLAVFSNVKSKYTDGEDRHKFLRTIAGGEHRWYKRLNVDKGLEGLPLDHWVKGTWKNPKTHEAKKITGGKTLTIMDKATSAYLDRTKAASPRGLDEYQPPKVVLEQVAERLVRHRRLREATKAKDPKKWQAHTDQLQTGESMSEDVNGQTTPLK